VGNLSYAPAPLPSQFQVHSVRPTCDGCWCCTVAFCTTVLAIGDSAIVSRDARGSCRPPLQQSTVRHNTICSMSTMFLAPSAYACRVTCSLTLHIQLSSTPFPPLASYPNHLNLNQYWPLRSISSACLRSTLWYHGWSVSPTFEVLRDPAAETCHPLWLKR
jgi:hypothetical protein